MTISSDIVFFNSVAADIITERVIVRAPEKNSIFKLKLFRTGDIPGKYFDILHVGTKRVNKPEHDKSRLAIVASWRFNCDKIMGNTHGRRSSQQRKHRKRPHSIAVDKPESWPSSKPSEMSRDSRQGSLRRRYSESGNYSYKTPWPLPLSEAVFLPEYDSKQPVKISDFEVCWQITIKY